AWLLQEVISCTFLSYGQIQHLVPLRQLDIQAISGLAHKTLTYAEQSVIFIYEQSADYVYYLLSGIITILPNAEKSYQIAAGSTRAHLPINSGQHFGATVVASTEVKILVVDVDLTQLWTAKSKSEISFVELMDLTLPETLDNQPFLHSFSKAYRENKLNISPLPNIALHLKEALTHDVGAQDVIDIIQSDPGIANTLIRLANSPLYAPSMKITSCQDVVTCLGLSTSANLVTCISLKQLFVCHDRQLMAAMQNLWRRSLYVSSLSFVLAEEVSSINSDEALLAGLISDIGLIPLLRFADQYPDEQPEIEQLESAVPFVRAPVGTLMLNSLGFSDNLMSISHHSEDWHYESGGRLSLIDIVILAKLHSYFGSQKTHHLPFINTIPAYAKLKNAKLTPDFSLNVLRQANQRIKAAITILA
ncbi:cyclic nucleotide-binding protein, partial [Methylococcaceae bacterium CS4]